MRERRPVGKGAPFAECAMARKDGGPGIRTPKGLRPAVFKTAALPVRSSPPNYCKLLPFL
jgi:hypothetical protein